ncbi:hypothetical protein H0H93_003365 [Arthromyces matolae]|nr:hypothetical protein H0H93_003365 [Arthromyces matolae]
MNVLSLTDTHNRCISTFRLRIRPPPPTTHRTSDFQMYPGLVPVLPAPHNDYNVDDDGRVEIAAGRLRICPMDLSNSRFVTVWKKHTGNWKTSPSCRLFYTQQNPNDAWKWHSNSHTQQWLATTMMTRGVHGIRTDAEAEAIADDSPVQGV